MNTGEQNRTAPALSARQQRLLAALVVNPDVKAACKAADVGRTTAYQWLRDPDFRAVLARERDAVFSDALAAVKAHVTLAVTKLGHLLKTRDARLRRMACNDIIGHALKVRELEDIEARLDAVENALQERGEQ